MATYVNDLRLKEIATGESAGTWGTETNVNLELIAEAMGHGSEAIANASTHTITMQDGVSDEFRSTFLRLTGGGQACTVTLAPNTLSHTWIMRNETNSTLTLTQGSGANVAISAGQTKIVTTDGAGSGAVVYEMDDLELAGNLAVGGNATVTGDIDVDGTVEFDALSGTGSVAVTDIADEDNMSSNSATKLATQQSIKAYVDSQVGTVDTLAEILANGNTTGSTDIEVTSAQKVQFRDSAIYINSSTDGQLDIVADTEIQIAATTIDINGAINASGEIIAASLDISGNIDVDGTTNLDVVDIDGAVDMASTLAVGGVVTANAGVVVDNITIDGNEIDVGSGDLTLDVAGQIILDADNAGSIKLQDGGTFYGQFFEAGNSFYIASKVSDGDMIFQGNDGGSTITALTLDMSLGGTAVFNDNVGIGQSPTAFSNWRVLEIKGGSAGAMLNFEDNSSARVAALAYDGGSSQLRMQTMINAPIKFEPNNAVALTLDGSQNAQFEGVVTANAGVVVDNFTLDGTTLALSSGDMTLDVAGDIILDADDEGKVNFKDGGTQYARIDNNGGTGLDVVSTISDGDIRFRGNDGGSTIEALTLDMSAAGYATFNDGINVNGTVTANNLTMGDDEYIRLGNSNDFVIVHSSSENIIQAAISDQDIIFKGNDGGSAITALTLDMSAAGAATFNSSVTANGLTVNSGATLINGSIANAPTGDGVHLGLTSNYAQMQLNGSAGGIIDFSISGTDSIGRILYDQASDYMRFDTNSVERFRIASDGAAQFGFAGAALQQADSQALSIITPASGGGQGIAIKRLDTNNDQSLGEISWSNNTQDGQANIRVKTAGAANTTDMAFDISNAGTVTQVLNFDGSAGGTATFGSTVTVPTNLFVGTSIVHQGDSDTSIDFDTNLIDVYAGGVLGVRVQPTAVTINETGGDKDFRVESNSNTHMLFVDGGNNRVGIGYSSPAAPLDIRTTHTVTDVTSANTNSTLIVGNTGSGNGVYNAIKFAGNQQDMYIMSFNNSTQANRRIGFFVGSTAGDATADERFSISGDGSLSTPTAGTSNVRFGVNAGNSIASGGNYNVVVGDEAGTAITTGDGNVAIGFEAGSSLTDQGSNVIIGYQAAKNLDEDSNVAIGNQAMFTATLANNSVAIGRSSLYATTTGDNNIGIGRSTLKSNQEGSNSVAIGYEALENQNPSSATNMYNVAVGHNAGKSVTTGTQNTLIGGLAGDALTDADFNVVMGTSTLSSDTKGNRAVAIGTYALFSQNFTSPTDNYNVAVGYSAGNVLTTGLQNTLIGGLAGDAITDADLNVALGYAALTANQLGSQSVAVGSFALGSQNPSSAANMSNTAVGHSAGFALTTGIDNTFVGGLAGDGTDDGVANVAIGYLALSANCGDDNVAIGQQALVACTGKRNTSIGQASGVAVTSGNNNIFLGHDAGRTGSPGGNITTADNILSIGDEDIATANIQVDWTVASDARDKTDFTALDLGLDFVKDLQPVTYKWDKRSKYGDKSADGYDLNAQTPDGTHKEDWLDIGFKAQEVEALEIAAGYNKNNKTNLVSSHTDDGKQMGLQYSKFVPILVKAIQEQQALIESLTARIETLEG